MRKVSLIFLILLNTMTCLSQANHGINWVQGGYYNYKISFKTGLPVSEILNPNLHYYFHSGSSCISDSDAKLKLICNGYKLMDSLGNTIDGGDTLTPKKICIFEDGWSTNSQMSIILPFHNDVYYVITSTVSDSLFDYGWNSTVNQYFFDLLLYHKVDMKLNSGLGKIVKKGIPFLKNSYVNRSQMMACRHADGTNWWLLKQARDTNMVYKFLVSEDSVFDMGTQGFPEPHWSHFDFWGQSMFSNQGNMYANVCYGGNVLFISDFNRCTGELYNPKHYTIPINNFAPSVPTLDTFSTGVCFSPNGRFLYISTVYNLYQLDLDDVDSTTQWYHIANLDTTYSEFMRWSTIYPSPDGKLCIGNIDGLGKAMSIIDSPNVKGIGCNFCPKCLRFPTPGVNNPACMPNYGLGADSVLLIGCAPVFTNHVEYKQDDEVTIYPNPTSNKLNIACKNGSSFYLYDLLGNQVVYRKLDKTLEENKIEFSVLPAGVYLYKVVKADNSTYNGKVIIE